MQPVQYFYGGEPGELTPDEVIALLSTPEEWIYFEERDEYDYAPNSLVALIASGDCYELRFGHYPIGRVVVLDGAFSLVERYPIEFKSLVAVG